MAVPGVADSGTADVVALREGWEYAWADAGESPSGWRLLAEPGWLTRDSLAEELWQRVSLPANSAADPAILLPGVFLFFEAYLDDLKTGGNADLDKPGSPEVNGFSWYLLELPSESGGGVLSLRIVSTCYLTGIGGTPLYGSRAGIYRWIAAHDLGRLAIASMCVLISLLSVSLYVGYRRQAELMAIFGARDVLSALGLVPRYRPILHIGMYCFVASLSAIAVRRAIAVHRRVEEYSQRLTDYTRERERTIHELHDGIGGLMTNINLIAEMERDRSDTRSHGSGTIAALAREGLTEIRRFMRSMDEDECTWEGLIAAFRRHGSEVLEPHGISLSVHAEVESNHGVSLTFTTSPENTRYEG